MAITTLKENYKRNVEIMKKNLELGMPASKAIQTIREWKAAFESVNRYGEEEKAFLNECLELVEAKTFIKVVLN